MALKNEIFGPLKTMSRDEYSTFYEATGIDVDGRRELVTKFMPELEQSIRHYISFAKAIPGFNSLCMEDQIALIKGRWICLCVMRFYFTLSWWVYALV